MQVAKILLWHLSWQTAPSWTLQRRSHRLCHVSIFATFAQNSAPFIWFLESAEAAMLRSMLSWKLKRMGLLKHRVKVGKRGLRALSPYRCRLDPKTSYLSSHSGQHRLFPLQLEETHLFSVVLFFFHLSSFPIWGVTCVGVRSKALLKPSKTSKCTSPTRIKRGVANGRLLLPLPPGCWSTACPGLSWGSKRDAEPAERAVGREAASLGRWRGAKAPVPWAMRSSMDKSVHGRLLRELLSFRSGVSAAASLCSFQPPFCSSWQTRHALSGETCLFVIRKYCWQVPRGKCLLVSCKREGATLGATGEMWSPAPAAGTRAGTAGMGSLGLAAVQHQKGLGANGQWFGSPCAQKPQPVLLHHVVCCCCTLSGVLETL